MSMGVPITLSSRYRNLGEGAKGVDLSFESVCDTAGTGTGPSQNGGVIADWDSSASSSRDAMEP